MIPPIFEPGVLTGSGVLSGRSGGAALAECAVHCALPRDLAAWELDPIPYTAPTPAYFFLPGRPGAQRARWAR